MDTFTIHWSHATAICIAGAAGQGAFPSVSATVIIKKEISVDGIGSVLNCCWQHMVLEYRRYSI